MIYDFVWAGNCNLINIKVLILFLPVSVKCYHLIVLVDWYFHGIKPADCITLPKKDQHICLESKGWHLARVWKGLDPLDLQISVTESPNSQYLLRFTIRTANTKSSNP